MDRRQFLTNILLVCIGLGLIVYLHYKITKLHNYVDKNNKIVFSLMTEMREEVKRHLSGEPLPELASEEALNAAQLYTTNDKNSHKIELSDDSESESDDTTDSESGDSCSDCDNFENASIRDIKEESLVNLIDKEQPNQEIKIINLMTNLGFENTNNIIKNVELDFENLIFYRHEFNHSGIEPNLNNMSDIVDIKDGITELVDIKDGITELVDIKDDITELVDIKDDITELVDIKDDITELVESSDNNVKLEKTIQDFSLFKVEDLRKMVHSKTGEKKEAIKKMKKPELVHLLSI